MVFEVVAVMVRQYDLRNCLWQMFLGANGKLLLLLLFLTLSILVANPKKLLYTVVNPARGRLNTEKRMEEKLWQRTPPPHVARSEKINKNHVTRLHT